MHRLKKSYWNLSARVRDKVVAEHSEATISSMKLDMAAIIAALIMCMQRLFSKSALALLFPPFVLYLMCVLLQLCVRAHMRVYNNKHPRVLNARVICQFGFSVDVMAEFIDE